MEAITRLLGYLRSVTAAGLPVPEGLRTLAARVAGPGERALLDGLAQDLEGGMQLSAALPRRLSGMPPLVGTLVAAGEKAGDLIRPVEALARYHQAQLDLERRVSASLRYPKLVFLIGVGLALPASGWASQQLGGFWGNSVQSSMGLDIVHMLMWPFGVAPLVWPVVALVLLVLMHRPFGPLARIASWVASRFYAVGSVRRHVHAAGFANGLALMLQAGVPLPEAVRLMEGFSADPLVADDVSALSARLASGQPLSEALSRAPCFPPTLAWMVSLGERGQALEKALAEAGTTFEREAHMQAELLSSALEPLLVAFLALIFLPALLAAYWPMISSVRHIAQ